MAWFWYALGAAILWGLSYTINQVTLQHFTEVEVLFFESVIIFVIISIYFVIKGDFASFTEKLTNPKQFTLILCSGIIYVVASWLVLKSITASNAGLAAIIESCYPIFTVLFAYLFFGFIQLNFGSAIGFVLILSGIIIVKIYGH